MSADHPCPEGPPTPAETIRALMQKLVDTVRPYVQHASTCSMNVNESNPDGDYCTCAVRAATTRANMLADRIIREAAGALQPRSDYVSLLGEAQQRVCASPLYRRFIDGTPLANDIAVWMADFAREATPAIDLTNHHNALTCPHCNPDGLTFVAASAERALLERLAGELQTIRNCAKLTRDESLRLKSVEADLRGEATLHHCPPTAKETTT